MVALRCEQGGCFDRNSRIASRVRYLMLLVGLTLCASCKNEAPKALEQVIEESHHLEPTGKLHIKNGDGSIRLYGWANPEVLIKATTRTYSAERLKQIKTQVSSRPDLLSIETIFPPAQKWSLHDRSGVVDYVIVMPDQLQNIDAELINGEISIDGLRAGNARALVENGRLSAKNCFTNINFEAKNGAIDFYYDWWESGAYVAAARIPNGGIGLNLPRDASFRVEAETQNGSVLCNLIDENEHPRDHRKKLTRAFGSENGPTFRFKAVDGNVKIRGY